MTCPRCHQSAARHRRGYSWQFNSCSPRRDAGVGTLVPAVPMHYTQRMRPALLFFSLLVTVACDNDNEASATETAGATSSYLASGQVKSVEGLQLEIQHAAIQGYPPSVVVLPAGTSTFHVEDEFILEVGIGNTVSAGTNVEFTFIQEDGRNMITNFMR